MIINGTEIAREILSQLKKHPKPTKFLAAVLIGDSPASKSFLKQKGKVAEDLGVDFRLYELPATMTQDDARAEVRKIAEHKTCGGVIVQLPLPEHIKREYVLNVVPREKDVDVLGERALGAFYNDRNPILPPAAGVVVEVAKRLNVNLETMKVAVVGAGPLVGRPVSVYLENRVGQLAIFKSSSGDVSTQLHDFDLVVSGVGKTRLFAGKDLKPGAVVIDFGYDEEDGKPLGDFDPTGAEEQHITYTPTPGGSGPILIAKLFQNFYALNS